jgi:hypothetical protein
MVSSVSFAQYSNHRLYQAYLEQDMTVWQDYIQSTNWDSLQIEEKKQLLNYEYGFTAYILEIDKTLAQEMILRYEEHLLSLESYLPDARYNAYLASLYTYKIGVEGHFIANASKLFACINQASKLDMNDPFVLSMMGNVEFYNPFGSKKKALNYFQRADSLYNHSIEEYEQWNHHFVQMHVQQCMDKLNKRNK